MVPDDTGSAVIEILPDNVPPDRVVDFDVYNPTGIASGFHESWDQLRDAGDSELVWTPRNEGHWIATRGSAIGQVLSDNEHFSNRIIWLPKSVGEDHRMLPSTMDAPDHQQYRRLLNSGLSPKAVRNLEETIRETAAGLIADFSKSGHCDFIAQYAEILPVRIFMAIVDLPQEDGEKLKYWSDRIVHLDETMSYEDAKQHFFDYLQPYIDARLGGDGTDMLSSMINGKVYGRALENGEMLNISMQLLLAGLDTVVNFLGFTFLFLAQNPEHRRRLADQPDLIPAALEELFRHLPIVSVAREVKCDMDFAGVRLKQGDIVLAPTSLVGRDDALNACPHAVDFDRSSIVHATFGKGNHVCPGAQLARTEMRITLEEWLKVIPDFELKTGYEIVFQGGVVGTMDTLPLVWPAPAIGG